MYIYKYTHVTGCFDSELHPVAGKMRHKMFRVDLNANRNDHPFVGHSGHKVTVFHFKL